MPWCLLNFELAGVGSDVVISFWHFTFFSIKFNWLIDLVFLYLNLFPIMIVREHQAGAFLLFLWVWFLILPNVANLYNHHLMLVFNLWNSKHLMKQIYIWYKMCYIISCPILFYACCAYCFLCLLPVVNL